MKKMKLRKTLSMLLCLLMLVGMFPASAFATDEAPTEPPAQTEQQPTECQHTGGSATCTELAVCDSCGENYGKLAGHNYENYVCTVCSEADPNYVPPAEPVCSCETDDPTVYAPFCAVYVRTYAPCECRSSCATEGLNDWCEHCCFEGAASCGYTGEESPAVYVEAKAPSLGTNLVYNGNAPVIATAAENSFVSLDGKTWAATVSATDAGSYTVYYKTTVDGVDSAIGQVTATIKPASITPSGNATLTGECLDKLSEFEVSGLTFTGVNGEEITGTWALADSFADQAELRFAYPGTTTEKYTFTFTPASSNYRPYSITLAAQVERRKIDVSIVGNTETVVYDGKEHSVSGYTLEYDDPNINDSAILYSGQVGTVSGINAGTYEYELKAEDFSCKFDNLNVEFTVENNITLTISKRPLAITAPTAISGLVFNGNDHELVNGGEITKGPEGAKLEYACSTYLGTSDFNWSPNIPRESSANTYYIWYRVQTSDPNWERFTCSAPVEVSIAKAEYELNTAPTPAIDLVYDGTVKNLVAGNGDLLAVTGHVSPTYYAVSADPNADPTALTWSDEAIAPAADAGTYYVWYGDKVGANDYEPFISEEPLAVTVAPRPITVTAHSYGKAYGSPGFELEYQVTEGELVSGDTLTGELDFDYSSGNGGGVGDYEINQGTLTNENNPNYNITFIPGILTITKGEPFLALAPRAVSDLSFNGKEQTLVTAGSSSGGTIQYAMGTDGTTAPTSGWSTEIPTGTNAGTYYVWYMIKGDSNHKDSDAKFVTVSVSKAEASDDMKTASGILYKNAESTVALPELPSTNMEHGTPTFAAPIASAEIGADGLIIKGSADVVTGTTYTVTIPVDGGDNYFDYDVTVSLTGKEHEHVWTYTVSGDTITARCSGTIGICPDAEQSITLTVPESYTYTGDATYSATVDGSIDGTYDVFYTGTNTSYSSADAPKDADTYTVTLSAGGKSVSGSFTINPKNIANCTADLTQNSFVYSGAAPELTVTVVDSGVGNTTLTKDTDYTVGTVSGVDAGDYKLAVTGKGNYTGSVELGYTIAPLELTDSNIELKVSDKVYTGSELRGVDSVGNKTGTTMDADSYAITGGTGTAVGTYTAKLEGKGNYTGTVEATWKITPPTILEDILNGTITAETAADGQNDEQYDDIKLLEEALGTVSSDEKSQWADELNAVKAIVKELEDRIEDIVLDIDQWLSENYDKADADELELRREFEKLMEDIESSPYKEQILEVLDDSLDDMHSKLYTYKIVSGSGANWVKGSGATLDLSANGDISLFDHLLIDGKLLDAKNYTVISGSTIVKLKADYLQTLSTGKHTIQFVYGDGKSDVGEFSVVYAWSSPKTGDDSDIGLWAAAMLMSVIGLGTVLLSKRKRKAEK